MCNKSRFTNPACIISSAEELIPLYPANLMGAVSLCPGMRSSASDASVVRARPATTLTNFVCCHVDELPIRHRRCCSTSWVSLPASFGPLIGAQNRSSPVVSYQT